MLFSALFHTLATTSVPIHQTRVVQDLFPTSPTTSSGTTAVILFVFEGRGGQQPRAIAWAATSRSSKYAGGDGGGGRSSNTPDISPHQPHQRSKRYTCFLSHYKHEAGTEARLVKNELKQHIKKESFLDSGKVCLPGV